MIERPGQPNVHGIRTLGKCEAKSLVRPFAHWVRQQRFAWESDMR